MKYVVLALLLLTGCGAIQNPFNPDLPYNTEEKVLFGSLAVFQAADTFSTHVAQSNGGFEANPVFGKDASTLEIGLVKIGMMGVVGAMLPYMGHNTRKWVLRSLNVMYGGIVLHNYQVIKKLD